MSFVVRAKRRSEVVFKPVQTVGPVTFGEVDGKAAFTTVTPMGEEWVWVLPILYFALPLILWIIQAWIWWWASSDLKFADISKIIGLLSPFFGVVAEALVR
jgi:hypothetical protein